MYRHDFNNRLVPKQRIQAALINDIFLACLMIIVSSCSIPYAKTISQYENAPICCTSMDKFIFETLQVGDSKSFDLNEKSPAYQFLTGKSYFKALSLPQSSYPYVVNVTSYVLGDNIDSAYIFYPQLITLNENYELIRCTNPQDFKLIKTAPAGGLGHKLGGEILFTENNKTEKYLVVLTTSELLDTKTRLAAWKIVPIIVPGFVAPVPTGTREVLIPHSADGRITISLTHKDMENTP